jgi:hypothetical protein
MNKEILKKTDINRELNLKNLMLLSSRMSEVEYFIFFGTLLGYLREGNLIKEDDDIDFYVNIRDQDKIINILESLDFNINIGTTYFVQAARIIEGINTFVDFYFYENHPESDHLIERWNFLFSPNDAEKHLHIPKKIIFPIKQGEIRNIEINIPYNVDACCRYLYGDHYKTPLKKEDQYKIKIVNNKPITILNNNTPKIPIFILVKDQPGTLVESIEYFHANVQLPFLILIHDKKSTHKETITILKNLEEGGTQILWNQNSDEKSVDATVENWLQNNEKCQNYFITDSDTSYIKSGYR